MAEIQAVFTEVPRVGERARIEVQGQPATTSPVVNIQTNPAFPGWYWVDTQSGSRYVGQLASSPASVAATQTVYGAQLAASGPTSLGMPHTSHTSHAAAQQLPLPDQQKLNWGAFILPLFWAMAHRVWIGAFAIVPIAAPAISLIMLIKGNEWAWQSRQFRDVAEFRSVQRAWFVGGLIFVGVVFIVSSIVGYQRACDLSDYAASPRIPMPGFGETRWD